MTPKPPRYTIRNDGEGYYCIWDAEADAPAELNGKKKIKLRYSEALEDLDELNAGLQN
jgi:hypothetical protein